VELISQTVVYTPSDATIGNPERGLQKYSITGANYATVQGANNLSMNTLNQWKNSSDQIRVVFRYFLLEDFINRDINATYLANIENDFNHIRQAGLKVIVRFSYSNNRGTQPQQPAKMQILRHIDQLKPTLFDNRDVIFLHQAGFLGTWGEWYYTNSAEFGTEGNISNVQWSNRKEIVNAMLEATPVEIPLQVRYVGIKTRLYGNNPLTEQTAYRNTAQARIGFYNDAFLNNWGDQGTYSVNSECEDPRGSKDYDFLANETQYLPMTGETSGLNPCGDGLRTKGNNVVAEMNTTNWTCLNRDYYMPFWDQIIDENYYDEILKNLGYRFVLKSSTVEVNGLDFDISLDLENVGFASVFKERPVYLVLQNEDNGDISTLPLNTDVRTWRKTITYTEKLNPGLTGKFQLYLWMPDPNMDLQDITDYTIRLANENIWDPSTGYHDLMQTIELSCVPATSVDIQTVCDSLTWIDGNTYSSSTDTATYTLTGFNGCDSIVQLDLTINKVSDLSTATSDTAILANNLNADYQWLDCLKSYQEIAGETNRSFFPTQSGEYAVELLEDGCRDTSVCILFSLVNIEENTDIPQELEIFPNPVTDILIVRYALNKNADIEIIDASGRIVRNETLVGGQCSIDLSAWSQGLYFIRVVDSEHTGSSLFIKK
jgi:hypothetical protein